MISVVTPTFNRKNLLKDVIECLLKQTFDDWELIIIDDCSTDGTEDMMNEYKNHPKINYYKNEVNTKNPGELRNKGFNLSKGEYVVFMDDDDYYIDNTYFERVMKIYNNNKEKNLCLVTANSYIEVVSNGNRKKCNIGVDGYVDGIEFLLGIGNKYDKPMSTFTSIFTRKSLVKGEFTDMKMMNDYAIYLRALLFGNVFIIDDCIGCYRVHNTNISFNIEKKFLMENIKERVWVKSKLINKIGENIVNKWWKDQMILLVRYYFFNSNPPRKDGKEIIDYILKNTSNNTFYKLIMYCMYLLYKPFSAVKSVIKK